MTDTSDSHAPEQQGNVGNTADGRQPGGAAASGVTAGAGAQQVNQPTQPAGTQPAGAQQPTQPYGAQQPTYQQVNQPYGAPQQTYQQTYQGYGASQQAYPPPYPGYQAPAAAGAYGAATTGKKSKAGWIAFIVVIAIIAVLFATGAYACSSAMSSIDSMTSSSLSTSSGPVTTGPTVAVIDIDGTIQYDGTNNSPEGLRDEIQQAEADDNIKAIVLRVNSGGGVSTAGEEMADTILNCSKPVVVSVGSMDASAAYMISSQADYIYANNTSSVGAIGTIMTTTDISELLDKLGISIDYIKSADSKDSSYGTRELTDEEKAYYQDLVDQINSYFIQTVADGRGMTVAEVETLATGLEFTGADGVENGLIDEIGTYDDALNKAAELGGISGSDYDVVNLSTSDDWSSLLSALSSSDSSSSDAVAADLQQLADDLAASNEETSY